MNYFSLDLLRFSLNALRANKIRTFLTALGLVIGNASVILVVTISITSRDYILEQIRGLGSNVVFAYYQVGNRTSGSIVDADYVKIADVEAMRQALGPRIIAATGIMNSGDRIMIQGKEQDISIIGSDEYYSSVRNLVLLAGRFMSADDIAMRRRVACLTERLSKRMYGGHQAALGQIIKLHGLQFTVIGTFKEKTESYGLSEIQTETILTPITVLRYFSPEERIDPMYVQVRDPEDVESAMARIKQVLESRHRPGAKYYVDSLKAILDAAKQISLILTVVLMMVSAIALLISGIGIMNIMLVTVTERTKEIGLRMSLGAPRRAVLLQFLAEAVLISLAGGMAGILVGVGIPWIAALVSGIDIPISGISVAVAFVVSLTVGVIFGLLPASRAAKLNPTEALRYE